jgi:hypothetical protein
VSCTVPQIYGGWAAFWMMPDRNDVGNQGKDGTEIDIFESINGMNGKISHAIHWDGYGAEHQGVGREMTRPDLYDDSYHKFGLWWSPTEYVFYIDDIETWRSSAGGVSQVEQYLKLTLEVTNATWAGNWADQIEKPIYWYIDYVRTYQSAPSTSINEGMDNYDDKKLNIAIYPNPTNGLLTISNQFPENTDYKIATLLGQIVLRGKVNSYNNQIDISSLPSNSYILMIGQQQLKIMKYE